MIPYIFINTIHKIKNRFIIERNKLPHPFPNITLTSAFSWPSRVIQISRSLSRNPNPFLEEPNKHNLAFSKHSKTKVKSFIISRKEESSIIY